MPDDSQRRPSVLQDGGSVGVTSYTRRQVKQVSPRPRPRPRPRRRRRRPHPTPRPLVQLPTAPSPAASLCHKPSNPALQLRISVRPGANPPPPPPSLPHLAHKLAPRPSSSSSSNSLPPFHSLFKTSTPSTSKKKSYFAQRYTPTSHHASIPSSISIERPSNLGELSRRGACRF
jgi:hypothetical protein